MFRMQVPVGQKKGEWVTKSIGCNCEELKAIDVLQKKVVQKKIDRMFKENSLVNQELLSASFESFNPYTPELKKAFTQAKQYANTFDLKKPRSLFFQSTKFGTGKSHLSMSIVKIVKKKGHTAIFISTPKLLTKIRSTYNKDSAVSEDTLLNNIVAADLVVFDDLGTENNGSWGREKLFEIIDQRLGKHNIYTTNLKAAEFMGDRDLARIFSRLMDGSEIVTLEGVPDYRMKKVIRHG